ncbi:flavodoxin family protein [Lentisphaerota bacterium ZTH]|nr:flavodoxin family protein [Lentisphaerota bacterium]WET05469.1 flavodoxin family protein [Lentisphaerota bacterium ZTH]
MERRILIITGSHRKTGNTALLSGWVADGARDYGAEVDIVDAAHLKYKSNGCTSCYGCQDSTEYRCIINDEASDIIASIPDYDVLVFASPVYFFSLSAQIKLIMDRMYSLFKFKENKVENNFGRTNIAVVASAAGDMGSGLKMTESIIKQLAGFIGRKHKSLLVPNTPMDPIKTATDIDIKEKAMSFGAELSQW